ncbi:unnamed protein product [Ceratitis capitata]|uniref:(Mediterranean fruit fly) hypothetical protein n=1 Tax=Ceratitis capitata TaxID=7213 RepID=A0A811USX5_CERCA|nr:unnamed protein product [Ceratitis capitata]
MTLNVFHQEEKEIPEVTLAHKKAKEWIVAMARANYQDLSKLAKEYPELVKLHGSTQMGVLGAIRFCKPKIWTTDIEVRAFQETKLSHIQHCTQKLKAM